jgi:hypothetical protein
MKPAPKTRGSADFPSTKILKSNPGFTSTEEKRKSTKKVKLRITEETVIIGFDTEWVVEEDISMPSEIPHNRILSYQYACRLGEQGWSDFGLTKAGMAILHPDRTDEIESAPSRVWFGGLLALAIEDGVKAGHLRRWPTMVVAAAHWTRADLSAMADYPTIKRKFDGVQKTYVTIFPVLWVRANIAGHPRVFGVSLIDTMLLAPGSQRSLSALGDLYGFPKLDPGSKTILTQTGKIERIRYIEHMDQLLADDPGLFERYAIRDAEISARHAQQVWRFANDELGLGLAKPPVTLGSLGFQSAHNMGASRRPKRNNIGQTRRENPGLQPMDWRL